MVSKSFGSKVKRYTKRQYKRFGKFTKQRYGTWSKPKIGNIVKDVQLLKSVINVEKKYQENAMSISFARYATSPNPGHYVYPLISIAQGNLVNQRNGNSVKATSLQYSLNVGCGSSFVDGTRVNIIIALKRGSLYDSTNTTGLGGTLIKNLLNQDNNSVYTDKSLRNIEHFRDWVILASRSFYFRGDESSTSGTENHNFKGHCKLFCHWKFDGATSAPIENQLYMFFMADNGDTATSTDFSVRGIYRIHYIDN